MKKSLLALLFIFIGMTTFATTYISTANGNWSSPAIWSPAGIPQPGDNVTINHDVVMDDTYTYMGFWSVDAGSITIGANGSLVQGTNVIGILIQNGGTITNNGIFTFDQLGIYDGTFTNNSTATFNQLIYNLATIDNYGTIQQVDSFYTSGMFTNYVNGVVTCDSIENDGTFTNHGTVTTIDFLNNSSFTNTGNFNFNRFYNAAYFENTNQVTGSLDATNAGYHWYNAVGATIDLSNNFTNGDSSSALIAVFINDGIFNVGNNWSNQDSTIGSSTGAFYIQNGTYNQGIMKGYFLFCDQSPTTSIPPIIDYNIGSIDTNITYCSVNIEANKLDDSILIYPIPAKDYFIVNGININKAELYDISGRMILSLYPDKDIFKVDVKTQRQGVYFFKIYTNLESKVVKLIKN